MFDSLNARIQKSLQKISGKGRLTFDNVKDTLKEIRKALIEADVAWSVAKPFLDDVRKRAVGREVAKSINPSQTFVKIVQEELTATMGQSNETLNLNTAPPAVILMAGLQGSGKTTSVAKLARYLKTREKKSVLVASTDIYRPAAIEQLAKLAADIEVDFFPSDATQKPVNIANSAIKAASKGHIDVVIIDTAGRLHIDDDMMDEISALAKAINPIETLFVVDSMTGQDAANTAKAFNDALPLTGVILTKADGDARGGAALSVRMITGKPIKFLGVGEKTDALEAFYPDRIASRILGMGDVVSLVEEAERHIDEKQAQKLAKKIKKGRRFNLEDFLEQLQQMRKMGGLTKLLGKLPMGGLPGNINEQLNDKQFVQLEAIIHSMTRAERRDPTLIDNSRKRRISQGSGTLPQDVNRLLKQFKHMQKAMKKFGKGEGLPNMMGGMGGNLPPGLG